MGAPWPRWIEYLGQTVAVLPLEPQVGDKSRRGMGLQGAVPTLMTMEGLQGIVPMPTTVESSQLGSVVKVSTRLAGLGGRAGVGSDLDVVKAAGSWPLAQSTQYPLVDLNRWALREAGAPFRTMARGQPRRGCAAVIRPQRPWGRLHQRHPLPLPASVRRSGSEPRDRSGRVPAREPPRVLGWTRWGLCPP